ncbi:MAG: DNA-directed RNA polymerase subunit omega [bacterium]|nr:DNA-directed RNA polymerase subunit omega [bacterium]
MIYPSIDKLLNLVDSKYRLVHIVAKRSDEMTKTGYLQKKESEYVSTKNIGRALEEIADGLIKITTEKEEKGKIKLQ